MVKKAAILSFVLLNLFSTSLAQNSNAKNTTLKKVFDNIVNAYGSAKSAPMLVLIGIKESEGYPASYISSPVPMIKIEEQVFDICMQMKSDSLNALAIILSHELAHYYNDHTWCTDYSYAIRNTALGKEIQKNSKGDQLAYETQADNNSFYYSCIAGYAPFGIYDKLIDAIYKTYKLPSVIAGYPGKDERKMIGRNAQQKIRQLYPIYDAGLLLLYLNYLPEAEACFDYLAKYFPSREIYSNLGVAKFLYALKSKPYDTLNFIYPIDIDPVTRLEQNSTRGGNEEYLKKLHDAKRQFEKAMSLDPLYANTFINLACVYDALGNYIMASGNLGEAEKLNADAIKLKHINAIVTYHSGNTDAAEKMFQSIADRDSVASFNYRMLLLGKKTNYDLDAIEKFKDDYLTFFLNDTSGLHKCITAANFFQKGKSSVIKLNNRMTISSDITGDKSKMVINAADETVEATIINDGELHKRIYYKDSKSIHPAGCLLFSDIRKMATQFNVD